MRLPRPPKSTRDREEWQREISKRTNGHGKRLDRHEALLSPSAELLTGPSAQLVAFLARACPDGLAEQTHDFDEVLVALPGTTADELREAAEERRSTDAEFRTRLVLVRFSLMAFMKKLAEALLPRPVGPVAAPTGEGAGGLRGASQTAPKSAGDSPLTSTDRLALMAICGDKVVCLYC